MQNLHSFGDEGQSFGGDRKIEALDEPDECTDVPSEVLDGSLEEVASCPETSPLSVSGSECIVQCENYTKSSKV
jgi:hypothetical protein